MHVDKIVPAIKLAKQLGEPPIFITKVSKYTKLACFYFRGKPSSYKSLCSPPNLSLIDNAEASTWVVIIHAFADITDAVAVRNPEDALEKLRRMP